FHVYATQFATGQGQAKAAAALAKLTKLPSRLKSRAELIAAMYQLDRGGAADKARAEGVLKRVVGTLPAAGQVAVRLATARSLAGLSRGGKRVSGSTPAYKSHLMAASQKAGAL